MKGESESVQRNYQVVGMTRAAPPTVIAEVDGEDPYDTLETAADWVGCRAALQPGGLFDYFSQAEKQVLRRGLRR